MRPDFESLARAASGQVIVDPDLCRIAGAKQLAAGALPVAMAVVRRTNTSDVQRSLAFAGQHALPLAVRGGGHCFGDFSKWTHGSRASIRSCPSSGSYAGYAEPRRSRLDALYRGDASTRLTALQATPDPMGIMRA